MNELKFFYIVSMVITTSSGTKNAMLGLGTEEELTYSDLVASADRQFEGVQNVMLMYKESITEKAYRHFWTDKEAKKEVKTEK